MAILKPLPIIVGNTTKNSFIRFCLFAIVFIKVLLLKHNPGNEMFSDALKLRNS